MTFAAGPWRVSSEPASCAGELYIRGHHGGYIASISSEADFDDARQRIATADLIAAAPLLLQALVDLEKAASAMIDCTDGSERGYLWEEMARARSIIAVARRMNE